MAVIPDKNRDVRLFIPKMNRIRGLGKIVALSNLQPSIFSSNEKLSEVEKYFVNKSQTSKTRFESEKIQIVEVENPFELGKLTALRFLEWVLANPEGVIALPTGKTPEYFLKFLKYYKKN